MCLVNAHLYLKLHNWDITQIYIHYIYNYSHFISTDVSPTECSWVGAWKGNLHFVESFTGILL